MASFTIPGISTSSGSSGGSTGYTDQVYYPYDGNFHIAFRVVEDLGLMYANVVGHGGTIGGASEYVNAGGTISLSNMQGNDIYINVPCDKGILSILLQFNGSDYNVMYKVFAPTEQLNPTGCGVCFLSA